MQYALHGTGVTVKLEPVPTSEAKFNPRAQTQSDPVGIFRPELMLLGSCRAQKMRSQEYVLILILHIPLLQKEYVYSIRLPAVPGSGYGAEGS